MFGPFSARSDVCLQVFVETQTASKRKKHSGVEAGETKSEQADKQMLHQTDRLHLLEATAPHPNNQSHSDTHKYWHLCCVLDSD